MQKSQVMFILFFRSGNLKEDYYAQSFYKSLLLNKRYKNVKSINNLEDSELEIEVDSTNL